MRKKKQKSNFLCIFIAVSFLDTLVGATDSEIYREENAINRLSRSTCSVDGSYSTCDGQATAELTVSYNGKTVSCNEQLSKSETEKAPSVTFPQVEQVCYLK